MPDCPLPHLAPHVPGSNYDALSEADLLACLLTTLGVADPGAVQARHATAWGLLSAPAADLAAAGITPATRDSLRLLRAVALRAKAAPLGTTCVLSSYWRLVEHVGARFDGLRHEELWGFFLGTTNRLLAEVQLSVGTVNHCPAYPREVARQALGLGATAVVLAHNHPGGDATPSRADIDMSKQVAAACATLGIHLHDHLVVAGDTHTSLRAAGLL